jgi:hypothetical protein
MAIKFEELAKRAVAARHWQWLEGMAVFTTVDALFGSEIDPQSRFRAVKVAIIWTANVHPLSSLQGKGGKTCKEDSITDKQKSKVGFEVLFCDCGGHQGTPPEIAFSNTCCPDFTDPCTVGALTAIVREAWGKSNTGCSYNPNSMTWKVEVNENEYLGETEVEAWVNALEAAP